MPSTPPLTSETTNSSAVIIKAYNNACRALGIRSEQSAAILGIDRATLARNKHKGFSPDSKTSELCLQLIRLYRSLFAIAGGDTQFMRHWLNSNNLALGGTPTQLVTSVVGLVRINQYLDAMRGKV